MKTIYQKAETRGYNDCIKRNVTTCPFKDEDLQSRWATGFNKAYEEKNKKVIENNQLIADTAFEIAKILGHFNGKNVNDYMFMGHKYHNNILFKHINTQQHDFCITYIPEDITKPLEFMEVDAGWYISQPETTLAIADKDQPLLKENNATHFHVYQFDEDCETKQRLIGIFDTLDQSIAYASAVHHTKTVEPYFTVGNEALPVSINALIQINNLPDALPLEKWQIELLKSVEVGEVAFEGLNMETIKRVG